MTTQSAPNDALPETAAPPPRSCSGCGHTVPEGADRCPHCGLAFGEDQRCPHCSAVAPVEKSATLRTVCSVCGRPRIRVNGLGVDLGLPEDRRDKYVARLRRAGHTHQIGATWRAIGFAAIGFGFFGLLVLSAVLSVAPAGDVGAAVAVLAAAIPIVVGLIALRRGAAARRESVAALDDAWFEAAAAVARSREGRIDAGTLARATLLDDASADSLLSRMTVQDRLVREVTSEGGLAYKLLEAASDGSQPGSRTEPRARVESSAAPLENEADGKTEAAGRRRADP
jgi:hypothetical protein